MTPRSLLVSTLLCLVAASAPPAARGQALPAIPEPLRPWVPWVLDRHPDLACPLVGEERVCAWPGRLRLELGERGGRFEMALRADRPLDQLLPGDAKNFPQSVTVDGRPALLRRQGEGPVVALPAGEHRVAGEFRWLRLPESLPIPAEIALVDLRLNGADVRHPHREAGGLLWLAARAAEDNAEDGLDLEVYRRIDDSVPLLLETRLRLRVSGQAREIALPEPLPADFEPVELRSELPARYGVDRVLRLQLRPGEWQVVLKARSRRDLEALPSRARPAPWPADEIWVFAADPSVRAVRVDGAPGIDPQRTALPEEWKALPAFQVAEDGGLGFAVLRRGEPQPPPDQIAVRRRIWLAHDGDRLTLRDTLTGTLNRGGRLEAAPPAQLGRVALSQDGVRRDQVITRNLDGEGAGVEVRAGAVELEADALYPQAHRLPAVGWNRDASSLAIELALPPGWSLLAAPGTDSTSGAWVDNWNLLDFFLLLIVVLAIARLDGWRAAALALVALVLAWQERFALALVWLLLAVVILRALEQLRAPGGWRRFLRGATTLALLALLLLFVRWQWRTGRYPQLEQSGPQVTYFDFQQFEEMTAGRAASPAPASAEGGSYAADENQYQAQKLEPRKKRASQIDPNAVVQTGPGVPTWQWRVLALSWQGPVKSDHQLRLWLISPGLELFLSALRILLFLGLVLLVVVGDWLGGGWRQWRERWRGEHDEEAPSRASVAAAWLAAVPLVGMLAFGATSPARADTPPEPEAALLGELEKRLTRPPACAPDCVELARVDLEAGSGGLRLAAEVHAAATTSFALPGPFAAFAPADVSVDGRPASALRLMPDGYLALRLDPGVHRVELRAPARDSLSLQFPLPPRVLTFRGDGFTLDGWREDEPPPSLVRIDRTLPQETADDAAPAAAGGLPPWLELVRRFDIGMPWLVHHELRRLGPAEGALLLRVPLLDGEAVTSAGVPVEGGLALVSLQPGETSREWTSTLAERPELTLTSPVDRPWLERWELLCSPIWHCEAEGLVPVRHMADGEWRPEWRPWPGETLKLRFLRPEGAPGQTLTIDSATLAWEPGRRLLEGRLTLGQRASRGGEQQLALPADAELLEFTINGNAIPVQNVDGKVVYTLGPGAHQVVAHWRQDFKASPFQRFPALQLPAEAANADLFVSVPPHRWLLATGGPDWGPVVLFWQDVVALLLAAFALGRFAPTPLRTLDWFLLGLGLTQIPFVAALVVVGFLCLLGWAWRPATPWRHDAWQLLLLGLGLIAVGTLYASIHSGLLLDPDMGVAGAYSNADRLHWYAERVSGPLPQPWVFWLPILAYRLFMLLWALWLASRCLRWLPWSWQQFQLRGRFFALPQAWRARREARAAAQAQAQAAPPPVSPAP